MRMAEGIDRLQGDRTSLAQGRETTTNGSSDKYIMALAASKCSAILLLTVNSSQKFGNFSAHPVYIEALNMFYID